MKKIISLLVIALCLVACNSVDQKLAQLEKACEDKNVEKAEKICASIDNAKLTAEQTARLTEATVKLAALKAEQFLQSAGEKVEEAVKEAGERAEEALENVSEQTQQVIEDAAKEQ